MSSPSIWAAVAVAATAFCSSPFAADPVADDKRATSRSAAASTPRASRALPVKRAASPVAADCATVKIVEGNAPVALPQSGFVGGSASPTTAQALEPKTGIRPCV